MYDRSVLREFVPGYARAVCPLRPDPVIDADLVSDEMDGYPVRDPVHPDVVEHRLDRRVLRHEHPDLPIVTRFPSGLLLSHGVPRQVKCETPGRQPFDGDIHFHILPK